MIFILIPEREGFMITSMIEPYFCFLAETENEAFDKAKRAMESYRKLTKKGRG